jgi:D-xylose transport system substrate-binding protein
MKKISFLSCVLFSGLILLIPLSGCGKKNNLDSNGIKVGLLMDTYDLNRWKRDADFFTNKSDSLGMQVLRAVADGDQDRQNKQADDFLTQGANVLVVISQNLKTSGRIVRSAHEKHIPVIAYDRLILDSDVDVYITFDNEKVGYLQAKGILEKVPTGNYILLGGAASDNNAKLVRDGQLRAINEYEMKTGKKINILADPFLDNWDRDEARRKISNLLTKFKAEGKKVDAIIASNDATAGGVVAALMAEHEASRVAVSGQDAELSACQRIVEGTQTVTVYKPVKQLATVSAEVAFDLAKKEKPEDIIKSMGFTVNYLDNGFKKVPTILLDPVFVTKDNMYQTVVKDGWQTLDRVYTNVPKAQWPKQ